ncbi:GNAT family N-acetyltransferase [Pseudomonas sp. A-RE-23]|uniref:GNAT family N-acetyltransferase n=1 Tax=Pseudomonas sp. A-RE-23 TaxID=2832376 RepID=UPI001CBB3A32|nr:GNAT family N-acetyltransferase [Pseudomonas sp. A-RE-23]
MALSLQGDLIARICKDAFIQDQLTEIGITPEAISQAISETPCAWVAEVNGVPVGFSMVDIEDGCVFAVFVLPEFEGYGLGRNLMQSRVFSISTPSEDMVRNR